MDQAEDISFVKVGKTIDNRNIWRVSIGGQEMHQPALELAFFEYGLWISCKNTNDFIEGYVWSIDKEVV
tara:strand:- start:1111 stop:1317 length:207 start_codon:yes stop_codon:yes gene_type:complete